ncbi:MAG: DUF4142 domain-containing protein [Sphingomonadaceae bacterium]
MDANSQVDADSLPAAGQSAAGSQGASFLTKAMKGDNSEVKLGKLAVSQAAGQRVRDFGRMLADDHSKAKAQVAALATSLGVAVTDEPSDRANIEYEKLKELSGSQFDKEFVSYMIEDHRADIEAFENEASSDDPPIVKHMAANTLPTLKKHLEKAQSLR